MSDRHIFVEEASVRTASVEIRALTVDKKQMTLAVFRQLIEEPLFDLETFALRGQAWGSVNYHPVPKICPHGSHRHVVWQLGRELRRATVEREMPVRAWLQLLLTLDEPLSRLMTWSCLAYAPDMWPPARSWFDGHLRTFDRREQEVTIAGETIRVNFLGGFDLDRPQSGAWWKMQPGVKRDEEILRLLPLEYEPEEDACLIRDGEDTLTLRRHRWAANWEIIKNLDQLFIAV